MGLDDTTQALLQRLKSENFTGRLEAHFTKGKLVGAVLSPVGRTRPDYHGLERHPEPTEPEEAA